MILLTHKSELQEWRSPPHPPGTQNKSYKEAQKVAQQVAEEMHEIRLNGGGGGGGSGASTPAGRGGDGSLTHSLRAGSERGQQAMSDAGGRGGGGGSVVGAFRPQQPAQAGSVGGGGAHLRSQSSFSHRTVAASAGQQPGGGYHSHPGTVPGSPALSSVSHVQGGRQHQVRIMPLTGTPFLCPSLTSVPHALGPPPP